MFDIRDMLSMFPQSIINTIGQPGGSDAISEHCGEQRSCTERAMTYSLEADLCTDPQQKKTLYDKAGAASLRGLIERLGSQRGIMSEQEAEKVLGPGFQRACESYEGGANPKTSERLKGLKFHVLNCAICESPYMPGRTSIAQRVEKVLEGFLKKPS